MYEWMNALFSYNCCTYPYSEIHCHLIIQRKPLYYIVNLIIPAIFISVIATFGFFTPVSSSGERTEKVNLGITTLLAMAVLLMVVSDHMPTTSILVPLISEKNVICMHCFMNNLQMHNPWCSTNFWLQQWTTMLHVRFTRWNVRFVLDHVIDLSCIMEQNRIMCPPTGRKTTIHRV